MHNFLRVFHVTFNHAIWESWILWIWLLIFLAMTEIRWFISTINLACISAHIPLFVVWNIARIRSNCSYNCDQKVEWKESKEASTPERFILCLLNYILITLPNFVKRNLWIVSGDRWIKEELNKKYNDETEVVFLHKSSKRIDRCTDRMWLKLELGTPAYTSKFQHALSSEALGLQSSLVLEKQSYRVFRVDLFHLMNCQPNFLSLLHIDL